MAKSTAPIASRTTAERALAMMADRGMVRLSELKAAGIPEMVLARLTRAGRVIRLARGLYQLPNADIQTTHTLAEVAKIVPKGVTCLISALAFHELTSQMPPYVWVAIETHTRQPQRRYPPMRFVRFGKKALIEGVKEHVIEGARVKITNPARTIVDCFRFRRKIGIDIAVSALRDGITKRRCSPDEIFSYAQSLRAANVIRPYIEALTLEG
jgi:predicted transcriptional regulator of viral defense system